MLREKFIALKAYIVKKRKSQINNLSFHLKKIEEKNPISNIITVW